MLKNYFKTAFRTLWRHKGFSALNITGLAVGMCAFFLIYQYIRFESSYDNFETRSNRMYRMVTDLKSSSGTLHWPSTTMPMARTLKEDYPDIEKMVRMNWTSTLLRRGEVKSEEGFTVYADSTLFSIFDFPLLQGDPATALTEPQTVVLSEKTAKKYFGTTNPIGQTMLLSDKGYPIKVTGVMKDIPENSSIKADLFISMPTIRKFNDSIDYRWGNFSVYSYLLLKPGANPDHLQAQLKPFMDRHLGNYLKTSQQDYILSLEKMKDVYWSSRGGFVSGSKSNVYIFSIIGLFILLIACINFVNLTTARAAERAKEVGIRKVVGAARFQLTGQFLGESLIISIIAFILSIGLYSLALPLFNGLAGKEVSTGFFSKPSYVITLFNIALSIGLLAGIYPALVLSSFKPIASLKGRFSSSTRGLLLRKGLVITQFTISIALIIGTAIVYLQLHYMRSQDLGFSKEQTLVIDTHNDEHKKAYQHEVASLPNVISTSYTGSIPGQGTYGAYSKVQNSKGEMQVANLDLTYVDFGYLEQYKMKFVAGRSFDKNIATDTTQAMILNEKAVRLFGYPNAQAAIGRNFDQWGKKGKIIGVIKDYNFHGLQQEITPLSICLDWNDCNYLSTKVGSNNLPATIAAMKASWDRLVPTRPFDYFFLDEAFDKQYRSEERFGKLFINFAVLAIFISCLGLLGLASYSTLQRIKEVGVRRVLGASTPGIVRLLSVDFLQLVLIAFVIAAPLSWFVMHRWLQDFAYRTAIQWWVFALSGLGALFIAFGTISYQAIRAARANPVKSLRSE
ncbi:MAG: ABC transporter permease [Bacteroidetes bacterium]|nr:ABC transporter permease [Bacteroidota bacterium]